MIRSRLSYRDKTIIGIGALALFGFFYRWYLSSLAWPTLIWDMADYSEYAKELLKGNFIVNCCTKNIGYSVFLAFVYYFFGIENLFAVRMAHITLDLGTSFLVYAVARNVFNKRAAVIAFFLSIVNPFTSSYTGLVLAETVTIFYISMVVFIITQKVFSQRILLWFAFGFVLGVLVFTRLSLYVISITFPLFLGVTLLHKRRIVYFFVISYTGFLIASSYSLVGYYKQFRIVSIVPPYANTFATLYTTFYHGRYPEVEGLPIHPEYTRVVMEYFRTPLEEKTAFSQKYQALFWQKLKNDWPVFLRNAARNSMWLWNKDHLYTYADPFYPADRLFLQMTNMLLLALAATGVFFFITRNIKAGLTHPLVLFTILLFLYITVFFSLVSNESRHSLIFYPLVFIWAGYALSTLWKKRNVS